MSNRIYRNLTILAVTFVLAGAAYAQSERITAALGDKYVISANAGGVNHVEGPVTMVRKDGTSSVLIEGDTIGVGDVITTGANAKAEILLNPGSYLRIGGNSSFEFRSTTLDDLRLLISKGSAVLEVFASNDFEVGVDTPKDGFVIVQSGIYRVDIVDDQGAMTVIKGRAEIAGDDDAEIKKGRRAVLTEGVASVEKFKSNDPDGLEAWSKSRSKELAKVSSSLKDRNLRTALMSSFLGNHWNMYDSFGLWVYDPFRRLHCFLPFGMGWGSPYGYGYGWGIWRFRLPPVVYQPPGGNVPVTPTTPDPRGTRDGQRTAPPFRKIESDTGSRVVRQPVYAPSADDIGPSRSPVRIAPPRIELPTKPSDPTGARKP